MQCTVIFKNHGLLAGVFQRENVLILFLLSYILSLFLFCPTISTNIYILQTFTTSFKSLIQGPSGSQRVPAGQRVPSALYSALLFNSPIGNEERKRINMYFIQSLYKRKAIIPSITPFTYNVCSLRHTSLCYCKVI